MGPGEEGVTLDDFILYQKAQFLDMVYLQQDAFDEVDASCPIDRQKRSFELVCALINRSYHFEDKTAVRDYFTRLTALYKNLNYAAEASPTYASFRQQIDDLAAAASQRQQPLPEKHPTAGSTTKDNLLV